MLSSRLLDKYTHIFLLFLGGHYRSMTLPLSFVIDVHERAYFD